MTRLRPPSFSGRCASALAIRAIAWARRKGVGGNSGTKPSTRTKSRRTRRAYCGVFMTPLNDDRGWLRISASVSGRHVRFPWLASKFFTAAFHKNARGRPRRAIVGNRRETLPSPLAPLDFGPARKAPGYAPRRVPRPKRAAETVRSPRQGCAGLVPGGPAAIRLGPPGATKARLSSGRVDSRSPRTCIAAGLPLSPVGRPSTPVPGSVPRSPPSSGLTPKRSGKTRRNERSVRFEASRRDRHFRLLRGVA